MYDKEFEELLITERPIPNEEISELYCKSIYELMQKLNSLPVVRKVEYPTENNLSTFNNKIDEDQTIVQRNLRVNILRRWNIRKKFEDKLGKANFLSLHI
ncbi:MAG: hypothetical protein M3Z01_00955 [Thermoproteota archaeon]|nr:hypothetical protein [Thermoproteota archaeon]